MGSLQQRLQDEEQARAKANTAIDSLQDKLASERAHHKEELATLRSRKAKELEDVSLRVRQTVAKKDTIIQGLRSQLAEAESSIKELMAD
jgi:hypothetical protein